MIDMGLVPPDDAQAERRQDLAQDAGFDPASVDQRSEEQAGAEEDDSDLEVVGLIGHFEAADLLAQKGKEGSFTGSVDMSMTRRELLSTEEGVGESDESVGDQAW